MTASVKAIVLEDVRKVDWRDVKLATVEAMDVRVKTLRSAVSVGTERWAYQGKRREIRFPSVLGYMAIGRVVEAGAEAMSQGIKPGDLIYFATSKFTGDVCGNSWMGSHTAEAVVDMSAAFAEADAGFRCCPLPPGVEPAEAILLALCAVAMQGIEMAVVPAGVQVLVNGVGILGQYAAQVCQLKGARVTVADVNPKRLEIAGACGIDRVVNVRETALADVCPPDGFDIIIDTSSIDTVVNSLFPLLRRNGKLILQGWYPPPSALDLNAAHSRQARLFLPCGFTLKSMQTALDWCRRGWLRSRPMVTHTFSPQEAAQVYAMLECQSSDFLGVEFLWNDLSC